MASKMAAISEKGAPPLTQHLLYIRTENWMLHLHTVRDVLPYFAATGHNDYTKSGHTILSSKFSLSCLFILHYDKGNKMCCVYH